MNTLKAWNDGELTYLAALVRTGGDSPRVPADAVDSYLAVQHAGARRDRRPDVCEAITTLMMIRAYVTSPPMSSDDAVVSDLWQSFWDRVHGEGVQS